jgi:hypothetical protein
LSKLQIGGMLAGLEVFETAFHRAGTPPWAHKDLQTIPVATRL